jgi:hypothetical protein
VKPEQLVSMLAALNGYLAAGEAAYQLGKNIINALRSSGTTTKDAEIAIAEFRARIDAASQKNTAWLDSHPREVEG